MPTTATASRHDDPKMAHAVSTALSSLDIAETIVREEFRCPMVIVRKDNGRLAVYKQDAWTRPTQTPMLPWSAPLGEPVATVGLDRSVTFTD